MPRIRSSDLILRTAAHIPRYYNIFAYNILPVQSLNPTVPAHARTNNDAPDNHFLSDTNYYVHGSAGTAGQVIAVYDTPDRVVG